MEIMQDYNERYGQHFSLANHAAFKKDLSFRLAHKEQYKFIDRTPEEQLDLLIVVDQMLTGFDSKWVNTLYMDKVLEYENIIQAFSRTNRLFGVDKPFGTIRYYRKPHTMEKNIEAAVELYSGNKPIGLFVEKLSYNLTKMNEIFRDISELFMQDGEVDFRKLPGDRSERAKFASLFKELNCYLEAAEIQGFRWDKGTYSFEGEEDAQTMEIEMDFDENTFFVLAQRYKELSRPGDESSGHTTDDVPYDLVGYLTEIDTGVIDAHYMNSRFEKYMKLLKQESVAEETIEQALNELHKTFAALSQEEQKYANIFLHDIQRGDVSMEDGKTFRDYITEYMHKAKNDQIHCLAESFGVDENKLRSMMGLSLTESNINEFGRLDDLKATVDKAKAREYFTKAEGEPISPSKVNIKTDKLLREFILYGDVEI